MSSCFYYNTDKIYVTLPADVKNLILSYKQDLEMLHICKQIYMSNNFIINVENKIRLNCVHYEKTNWFDFSEINLNDTKRNKLYQHLNSIYSYWIFTEFQNNTTEQINLALIVLKHCILQNVNIIKKFGNYTDLLYRAIKCKELADEEFIVDLIVDYYDLGYETEADDDDINMDAITIEAEKKISKTIAKAASKMIDRQQELFKFNKNPATVAHVLEHFFVCKKYLYHQLLQNVIH